MPDAAGVGGGGVERSLRDKGGKAQGCAWVTAACSARAVTLCGRWLQAQRVRLPGHLLFAGKQVSRAAGQLGQAALKPPTAVGDLPSASAGRPAFRFRGASARSTTPFCASRILGAQIWNPREEGVRPAPRALSLSWCPWQTLCLRLALPPRLSPEQDDCGHLRPGEGAKSRCRPRPSRGREAPAGGPALVPALRLPQLQPGRERRSFQGL